MRRFDQRWKECVNLGRQAGEVEGLEPPSLASIQRRRAAMAPGGRDGEGTEAVAWWQWYGLRGMAVAVVLLVGSAIFALRGPREAHPLRPGVEDAVAEVFWLL